MTKQWVICINITSSVGSPATQVAKQETGTKAGSGCPLSYCVMPLMPGIASDVD